MSQLIIIHTTESLAARDKEIKRSCEREWRKTDRSAIAESDAICNAPVPEAIGIELPTEDEINKMYPERNSSGTRLDTNMGRREGFNACMDFIIKKTVK